MDQDRYDRGLAVRREVLGAEHVDRSIQGRTTSPGPCRSM